MKLFDEKVLKIIRDKLIEKKETLAVAESVTSGFIQLALSTTKDASKFYQGGITAYNVGQKYRHLQVEPIHAIACNCVSEKVAVEMASYVCELFKSDWGLGITGYAAPVEESEDKLFAFYAITYQGRVIIKNKISVEEKDSFKVQLAYVTHLLQTLKSQLY